MFKNMGRQSFGKIQAKLFPKYFLLSVVTLAIQMGTLKFALPTGLQQEQLTSLGAPSDLCLCQYSNLECGFVALLIINQLT